VGSKVHTRWIGLPGEAKVFKGKKATAERTPKKKTGRPPFIKTVRTRGRRRKGRNGTQRLTSDKRHQNSPEGQGKPHFCDYRKL